MLIEAFRRKATVTHEIGGVKYTFAANEAGHIVSKVEEPAHAERFLAIAEAFRPYGVEVQAPEVADDEDDMVPTVATTKPEPASEAPSAFLISNGETTIDLAAMDDRALKELARELGVDKPVDMRKRGDALRAEIITAVKALSKE